MSHASKGSVSFISSCILLCCQTCHVFQLLKMYTRFLRVEISKRFLFYKWFYRVCDRYSLIKLACICLSFYCLSPPLDEHAPNEGSAMTGMFHPSVPSNTVASSREPRVSASNMVCRIEAVNFNFMS